MSELQLNVSLSELQNTIKKWLQSQIGKDAYQWITEKSNNLQNNAEDWEFFSSFSAVPRHTGKDELQLNADQQQEAEDIRSGWRPGQWSVDQLGRTLLILSIPNRDKGSFLERVEKTFVSSDMGEAVALYQALPVLLYPEDLTDRAAEGIRSNMTSVFNAVALDNPYPKDYFRQGAWNQLVLKALFVQSPLYRIQGIDQLTNKKLADMLVDYAHERWAAERDVSPELWRPVGPFAKGATIDDLKKVLAHSDPLQQQAAILALSASSDKEAKNIVNKHHSILDEIEKNNINWNTIGKNAVAYR